MRKICCAIFVLAVIFGLCGCENKAVTADVGTLADALNSELQFGEELEKSESEVAYSVYGIDPALCSDACLYLGSGATADEIAVFKCVDGEAVEKVKQAANSRLQYLLDGYSSYGPQEVPKIKAASVIGEGDIVLVCICENSENVGSVVKSHIN